MLAIDLANRVMEESQKGHLIIEDGELVTPVYSISVEDGAFSLYIELSKSVKAWIVGCERDDQNRTYTTKTAVREYFSKLKIYRVVSITGLILMDEEHNWI